MSSSSRVGGFGRIIAGAVLIVVQAAAIGLAANALNPHGLPWIRVPLRETHKIATSRQVLPVAPAVKPPVKPASNPLPAPAKPVQPVAPPKPTPTPAPTPGPKPNTKVQPSVEPAAKPKKIEALFTTLPDAKALFDKKAALFIDARHREDYDVEHIPGAKSMFVDDVGKLDDSVLGGVPKDRTIVTYCSDPQCETAIKVADALAARGHTRVFILLEGLPGWKDAGYPTTKAGGQ
jgi:rhodanese-related sulfurtransferase